MSTNLVTIASEPLDPPTDIVTYWLQERRFGDLAEVLNHRFDLLQVLPSKQAGAKVQLVPKLFVIGNYNIFLFDQNQKPTKKGLDKESLVSYSKITKKFESPFCRTLWRSHSLIFCRWR